jgi:hypothetical protein
VAALIAGRIGRISAADAVVIVRSGHCRADGGGTDRGRTNADAPTGPIASAPSAAMIGSDASAAMIASDARTAMVASAAAATATAIGQRIGRNARGREDRCGGEAKDGSTGYSMAHGVVPFSG